MIRKCCSTMPAARESLSWRHWRVCVARHPFGLEHTPSITSEKNLSIPTEPFRIAGNLYYVGHTGMGAYLLTGPEGHVLIDGGYRLHPPLIEESISKLGFDIADVKVLLMTFHII